MLKFWKKWTDRGTEAEAGFTLIEMSIVLVIIGLLIGGVLKGQELIASTRLKAVVTQWDAVKASYNSFQDRFLALPGDLLPAAAQLSATGVSPGNGNGVIGANVIGALAFAGAANVAVGSENMNFWAHLAAARLLSNVVLSATPSAAGVETAAAAGGILPARIAGTFWTMENATPVAAGLTSDFIVLQTGTAGIAASLRADQYAELERKYDNSNSLNGSIVEAATGACTTAAGAMTLALGTVCIPLFSLSQ